MSVCVCVLRRACTLCMIMGIRSGNNVNSPNEFKDTSALKPSTSNAIRNQAKEGKSQHSIKTSLPLNSYLFMGFPVRVSDELYKGALEVKMQEVTTESTKNLPSFHPRSLGTFSMRLKSKQNSVIIA